VVLTSTGKNTAKATTKIFSPSSTPSRNMSGGTIAGVGIGRMTSIGGCKARRAGSQVPSTTPSPIPSAHPAP